MCRIGATRKLIAALALVAPAALDAAGPVTAFGDFWVDSPYLEPFTAFDLPPPAGPGYKILAAPPFPLDVFLRELQADPGFFVLKGSPWDPAADAAWVYANEAGRTRAMVDLFNFHAPDVSGPTSPDPSDKHRRELDANTTWQGKFPRVAGVAQRTFTVNASHLGVTHPHWYDAPGGDVPPTPPDLPYARLKLVVAAAKEVPPTAPHQARQSLRALDAMVELVRDAGAAPHGTLYSDCRLAGVLGAQRFWQCGWGLSVFVADVGADYLLLETRVHHGTIDLGGLDLHDGDSYFVLYHLDVEAGSYANIENWATAYLGDPLDPASGLELEDAAGAPAGRGPRICSTDYDAGRFGLLGDGTATDRYTGLAWQRCPAGFTLDDAGTPGDPADDRCLEVASVGQSWQEALQHAAGDRTAGQADWRVPSVKELESLVELDCWAPTIEGVAFPDTPAEPFWSSTPGRSAGRAMAVSFGDGSVLAAGVAGRGRVRLVRDGASPAAAALPSMRLGQHVEAAEGDGVVSQLLFTVYLDRAAAEEVTVSYRTEDGTALAGEDYAATSGLLRIPAGARVAQVAVPVLADTLAEQPEHFFLLLESPSANARLSVSASRGTILDAQPEVSVAEASSYEGDAGASALSFLVTLGKPATQDVVVTYATSDGTATGSDYVPATGTVLIPAGQVAGWAAVSLVGDTVPEGDEYLTLTLTAVSPGARLGAVASAPGWLVEDDAPVAQALNDTGIGLCTNGTFFLTCPQASHPGQDGDVGRDATANGGTDGYRGFSFTKLDATGAPLADQAQPYATAPWDCVRDEVTALVWEVKTNDGGLHDRDWTYTWYNSTGRDDGGSAGTQGGGSCSGSACDTESFAAAVNAAGWCGANDWRLPTREELRSLVVFKDGGFAYLGDPPWFPNTPGSHWSATPSIDSTKARYLVQTIATEGPKSSPQAVRLVRGGI